MSVKVFGIGLNKTGTTTLGECLARLGYHHTSFSFSLLEQVSSGDLDALFTTVDAHDSFEDWPYPLVYKQLDCRYPGSRFILTRRRSPEVWLRSLEAHALRTDPRIGPRARTLAYGWPFPQLNPDVHLQHYSAHLQEVRSYFQNRPHDFLEVCWEEQATWEPLCQFLGCPVPPAAFPHANAAFLGSEQRLRENQHLIQRARFHASSDDPPLP